MKIVLFLALVGVCVYFLRRLSQPGMQSQRQAQPIDEMTVQEALDVLGLNAQSDKQAVIEAHRRLMQHLHPDKGGSAVLARQLNEAKRILLKSHT